MKIIFRILIVILVSGSLATAGYFYWRFNKITDINQETKTVVAKVSKLMYLPDEAPTLASVTDKDKLANQKFFQKAENGDKVLIFPMSSKAILYRPSVNKIVEVAAVITSENGTASATTTPAVVNQLVPIRVAIYNGTKISGLAARWEKIILSKMDDVEVAAKASAKGDYLKTMVIDLNGKLGSKASQLAEVLGARLTVLPEGEARPEADLLVILGEDKE